MASTWGSRFLLRLWACP